MNIFSFCLIFILYVNLFSANLAKLYEFGLHPVNYQPSGSLTRDIHYYKRHTYNNNIIIEKIPDNTNFGKNMTFQFDVVPFSSPFRSIVTGSSIRFID
jgi:hypothetical protein